MPKSSHYKDEKAVKLLGARLRAERERKGYTQEELALEMGVSHNHVARVERGEVNVTISTVFRLAEALKVPAWELIKEQ